MQTKPSLLLFLMLEGVLLILFGLVLLFMGEPLNNKLFLTGIASLALVMLVRLIKIVTRKPVE
ncbi:MAG TPA: hypothetical protein VET23_06460 [Chitinophagaceae bacterium]|nr:hypothetical protein [Chitinophagaceae bacterium]